MEKFNTHKIVCEGGLNSNQNYLLLSDRLPGSATSLLNFEPSLYGGYRRLSGFTPLEEDYAEVDATNAEGKILGISIFDDGIITARAQKVGGVYNFYYWTSASDWTAYTTGLTLTSAGINRLYYDTFNFNGTEKIIFTDGVNNPTLFDGTNWSNIDPAGTGVDYANAGGNQALDDPKWCVEFKNHIFVAGDSTAPNVIAHSAPNAEYDWLVASGAGQIVIPFKVVQIKPFRDELYVFGEKKIKKIVVESTTFVVKDVATNIGCVASGGVVEINGDLLFLAQDGLRTIAGTDRVGDIELGVQSKDIQRDITDLITSSSLDSVTALVVRKKSQVRFFFSDENLDTVKNTGVIGGLKGSQNGVAWEWGRLKGIRASCVTSSYIDNEEYILHGDFNGKVYRQEIGNDFDGSEILAVYTMPYNDLGDPLVRKTIHKVSVFLRAEGNLVLSTALQYDWNSREVLNPVDYILETDITGAVYGTGVYGTAVYATAPLPVILSNVEGSGFSFRFTFSTNNTDESYSIQAIVIEYAVNGRK